MRTLTDRLLQSSILGPEQDNQILSICPEKSGDRTAQIYEKALKEGMFRLSRDMKDKDD